jgi:parvulin-like peptidyl-prolyl isomerase
LLSGTALLAGTNGCGALASSPGWVGGGLAVTQPQREAEEDAKVQADAERLAREPKEIGARHILIMHIESQKRPDVVTRTKAEARKRAEECLRKIRAGADFDEMVAEYSDEPGAAERHGDLGVFERGAMVKSFADAAFGLKVGEVSEIVETPYGFHIIKRTE